MSRRLVAAGAGLAFLAVALGAFGTHVLEAHLAPERLETFATASRYQMYHALAILLAGLAGERLDAGRMRRAGALFLAGTLVFCGSLYGLAFGAPRWLGAVAPAGGLAFLAGWALFAAAALARPADQRSTQ